jgi:phage recombination protein Bet
MNMALAPTAPGQIQSANEMVEALKAVQAAIAPDLNPAELRLFAMVAYRSGLDPFARQIHAVKRQGKVTFQTGIDGFRSSAERTGKYDGQDEPEFGPICSCNEAPKPHPEWARVTVYRIREDGRKPQSATAYWHEFKPAPGASGNGDSMWKKMPRNQLAKCAEALAFRKAFPYVLADVYSHDEMAQADNGPRVVEHRPTARDLVAERRAAIEHDAVVTTATADEAALAGEIIDPAEDAPGAAADLVAPTDAAGEADAAAAPDAGADEPAWTEAQPDPAIALLERLRTNAEASALVGPMTDAQQKRLVPIFAPLKGVVGPGVRIAFGDEAVATLTAAQAQAIANVSDSMGADAFVEAWRELVDAGAAA